MYPDTTPQPPPAPYTAPDDASIQAVVGTLAFTAEGLIPAIAQDVATHAVLMLAWMNAAAVEETLRSGRVCYWSRSRAALWRKGETSGHVQQLVDMRYDCDADALLLRVRQTGPACHTGAYSCFFRSANGVNTPDQST